MWNFLKTLVLGFRPVQTTGHRAQSSLSGEARSLSDEIDKLRINANRLAAEFKRCYQEEPERQVELRRLASEAQSEADEMRRFFRCSQEAYNDGDGAAAKALSIEGKEHQCRAESLNSRAREIRDIGKLGKHKELECRELNSKIALRSKDKERLDYALDLLKSRSEAWTTTIDRRLGTLPGRVLDVFTKMEQDDPDGLGLFLRGLANPALDEEMACQLPLALADLLGAHPVAAGMFPRLEHRGPGARAWATNLANPDGASAAGTAYELLATSGRPT